MTPSGSGNDSGGGASDGPSGAPEAGTTPGAGDAGSSVAGPSCKPTASTGSLPFVVDSVYVASGYMGDAPAASAAGGTAVTMLPAKAGDDATCGGNRASAGALGSCHTVSYTPLPPGTGNQWAGVFWQYPANNWGAMGGYALPAGATQISFSARGKSGGEHVLFGAGYTGSPTPATPCTDSVMATTAQTIALTTAWQRFTVSLAGQSYPNGVLGAFDWTMMNPAPSDGGPAAPVTFFVDDIQWQP